MASSYCSPVTFENKTRSSFALRPITLSVLFSCSFSAVVVVVSSVSAGNLLFLIFAAALIAAAYIDTKTRLIPNRLTYPLILLGLCGNLVLSFTGGDEAAGVIGTKEPLKGAGVCFGLMLVLFVSNATGGGDVKLATAIGAFLGPQSGLMAIAWCHVLAGVFVLVWLLCQLNLPQLLRSSRRYFLTCLVAGEMQPIKCNLGSVGQKRIPMAAFFTLGVLATLLGYRLW